MKKTRFSKVELKQLAISILVMSLAVSWEMTLGPGWVEDIIATVAGIIPAMLIIAPAFAFHELGHKFAAQKYGYFAEYRMWKNGLIAALVMAIVTSMLGSKFLFIAPGAVYFSARHRFHGTLEDIGRIGFAGPLVNLSLVAIFGLIGIFSTSAAIIGLCAVAVYVNAFLAIFNLIPFGPLDGKKVLTWNRFYWGLALAIALAALLFGDTALGLY